LWEFLSRELAALFAADFICMSVPKLAAEEDAR